jgi:guanylate kinase
MADMQRKGFMLVLSSPSGAGKTTLSRAILAEDAQLTMSVSVTTRGQRLAEEEGKDYYFVTHEQFARMREGDELLEHAEVFGNFYGTPRKAVEESLSLGRDVLFDIDWQGAAALTRSSAASVVSVFILPPSLAELEKRLRARGQDAEEIVARRMAGAKAEISHFGEYDYVIVNHDLGDSLYALKAILCAERLKTVRRTGLQEFAQSLVE